MSCAIHPDRAHVGVCSECGRLLCQECVNAYNPPHCIYCTQEWGRKLKRYFIKIIVLSLLLGFLVGPVFGAAAGGNAGIVIGMILIFAGVPWGWITLNKITPRIFLVMPLIGWVFYFFIKFFIAFFIGIFAMPFQIYRHIKALRVAKSAG